jgi:hydroxymethylpyrimidine pyrophosphatase-like HAD family hydrolase
MFNLLDLEIETYAVAYHNGAIITAGGVLLKTSGIDARTVKKLAHAAAQFAHTKLSAEIDDTLYANFDASAVWPGVESILTDFSNLPDIPTDNIIFSGVDNAEATALMQTLDGDLYWDISENEIYMIMNKAARKLNAVSILADHFKISQADIAAFGDIYNDIEILRDCGVGVAVANAIDEAKAVADFICPSNEEDGVALWIEENIL